MMLLLGIMLLASSFFIHLAWWRIALPKHHTNALLLVFGVSPLVVISLLCLAIPQWAPTNAPQWIRLLLFYIPFSLTYIGCYSMLEIKSAALSMVEQIDASGESGLSIPELKASYAGDDMMHTRLNQMKASRMIGEENNIFRLLPKGRRVGLFFSIFAWLLGVEKGG